MENKELRTYWNELHTRTEELPNNLKEVIRKKHCKIVSKALQRQKKDCWIFAAFSLVMVATTIWDRMLMGSIDFSIFTGLLFFVFSTLLSYNKYRLLTKTADPFSVKESTLILKTKLKRTMAVEFVFCLLFFYGIATRFMLVYLGDMKQLQGIQPILWILVLLMLAIPWLLRYLQKQQYKHYLTSLEKSISFLEGS